MTDREELVKLADFWERKAEFDRKMLHPSDRTKADDYVEETAKILRRLASSDGGVKGEPVAWPTNLNPRTLDLVQRFALALAKKLRLAEEKYGHTDGWSRDDWEAECRDHLYQHLEKGDPRDVAAYCAFMWHHGWITYRPATTTPSDNEKIKRAVRLLDQFDRDATIGIGVSTMLRSALGVIGQRGAAPPADAGMREALQNSCLRLQSFLDTFGDLGDCVTQADINDWLALTAPGATTKSDVEALAATTAERPGTVTSEPEPSASDPSSTRSEVTALAKRLDQVLKAMRGARNRSEPMAVWADDIKVVEDARTMLDQFEIRRK